MSGIIRIIKAKDDNNVEQNIFPKTVLEAVVDSETNETLDVILDNLNEKIDNIEPGSGGGGGTTYELSRADDTITLTGGDGSSSEVDVSDKVSKSGDTMTGALTVKANVNIPLLSDNSDTTMVTVPTAGTVQLKQGYDTLAEEIVDAIPNYKSFIGSVFEKNVWHNLISARHRNGVSDGANYGMYLKAPLTRDGNLVWNKQHGEDTWSGERTIFDSNNYSNYVKPKLGGIAEQTYNASVWGTAGYIVLAKIWVNGQYMSGANIAFTLSSLGGKERTESKIIVRLNNVEKASDTRVTEIATYGTPTIYYVVTSDTSANTAMIEIIATKQAYEDFAITHVSTPKWFRDRATVSFPMTFETSLRSGAVAATSYTMLDSANYNQYALPLTGGKVTGATQFTGGLTSTAESTILQQDYYCHTFAGGGGSTTGHIKFATIKTNNTYIGGVLKMTIHTRNCVGDLLIGFNGNVSEAGANLSYVRQTGNLPQIYIHKSATQTFDLYIYKMAYESCTVSRIDTSVYMKQRTTITWSDTYASAVPEGSTSATKVSILDSLNYSSYALPLAGGTLTGAVKYGSYNMLEYNSTSTTVSNTNRPNMYFGNDNTRTVLRGQVYINNPGVAPCTQVMWAVISDARLKENIIDLTSTDDIKSKYIQLWDKVNPMEYNLTYNSNKKNLGYVAQDFIEAMEELGIDYEESSIVNIQPNEQIGEDGICSVSENSEYFEELYTLNYDECAMLTTLKVKQIVNEILPNMQAEIDALKEQNELLKEQIRLMKEGN